MKIKRILMVLLAVGSSAGFIVLTNDPIQVLTEKLEAYHERLPQSKIHAFFSQDKFIAGDTAYFNTFLLNEDLKPFSGPQIVNLELVDAAGKGIYNQQIKVVDGIGSHELIFPGNLSSGAYIIRLYTNWMRNFAEDFQFRKRILIAGKNQFNIVQESVTPNATFYPEGGTLIAGVNNQVAVLARNMNVAGGVIKDSHGSQVATFSLNSKGLGTFSILPGTESYFAELISKGEVKQFKLPEARQEGCAIHIAGLHPGNPIPVKLSVPPASLLKNQQLVVLLVSRSKVSFSRRILIGSDGTASFELSSAELPEGIAEIFVFTEKLEELAQRLVYIKKENIHVSVNDVPESINTRQEVTAEISLTDENNRPIAGNFAVSIINKNVSVSNFQSIRNDLLWYSDVPDMREDMPGISLEDSTLNDYLITQKWKRFDWSNVIADVQQPPRYAVNTTLTWQGVAINRETGQPLPDSTKIMAYLLNNAIGYEILTKSDGSFEIPVYFDFFDADRLFYIAENHGKEIKNVTLKFVRDSVSQYKAPMVVPGLGTDWYWDYTQKKRLINKSYSFFAATTKKDTVDFSDPNDEIEGELMGADISINLDEYVVFRTMEDVVREVVPTLQSHMVNGVPVARLLLYLGMDNSIAPKGEPLYVIDGVMTKDTRFFLSLNPADIISIKLVRKVYKLDRFGILGKNGVVLIHTKNVNLRNSVPHNAVLPMRGLNRPILTSVMANNSNLRIPEFTTNLYWNPSIKTNPEGKASFSFYTTDDIGPFIMRLEGLTSDGRIFSTEREFNTVFKPRNN